MKKYIKIISFVFLFLICLPFNVSNAFTLNEIATTTGEYKGLYYYTIGDLAISPVYSAIYNKRLYPDDEEIDSIFNQKIESVYNEIGVNSYIIFSYINSNNEEKIKTCFFNDSTVNLGISINNSGQKRICIEIPENGFMQTIDKDLVPGHEYSSTIYTVENGYYYYKTHFYDLTYLETSPNLRIYNLATDSSDNVYWDGTYYGQDPSEPIMPTNSEIAQTVQAFYNSDYYKNNKDFKDFIVMYNYKNQYFSFIGHNFGSDLGQVIVPSDYKYEGYSYKQDWWKFFLRNISSEISSKLWNKYYWLYSTNNFGTTITSNGKGSISDLVDLHFTTSSIIVYSTTDYPVINIETDENGVLNPVEGTIPGNQYTYEETLDPTINEYNPLEDFITVDPSQSILGDVDFDEINKVFEENKNILNIENASWLFTANNQLISYFLGFISFLIVLLIISRLLGG